MRVRALHGESERTFAVVFDTGDDVTEGMLAFAREHGLEGAHFTAIGALQNVTLGYWDWTRKDYDRISVAEQVEVLSLVGNIAVAPAGGPMIHAHVVIGKSDGTAHGGHLLGARVRPTLEVIVTESPRYLRRRIDAATGLALLHL